MEWGLIIGRSLHVLSQVALIVLLVRGYMQTRNMGFAWLGAALLVWPEIVKGIAQLSRGASWPSMLGPIEYTIGWSVLLVAVFFLGGSRPDAAAS